MEAEKNIMTAKDLAVGYDRGPVAKGIDLDIKAGKITVLIGPNGAGKTTLLKTLCGDIPPVAGEVLLHGVNIQTMKKKDLAREIALLLTGQRMAGLLSCREVVSMGRFPYTGRLGILSPGDEEVVSEVMELLNIESLSDRAYDRISDGQKQRVLIARALCQKPGLLIMDEPASFLDIRYQLELMEILRDLTKMGISVVISMHELMLAKNSADSIICIHDGGISSHDDVKGFFEGDEIYKVFGISPGSIGFL